MTQRNPHVRLLASVTSLATDQGGNSLIETALVLPILLLLLAVAVDVGRAYRASMIVNAAARAGAAYGIHYPTDTAGMVLAAKTNTSTMMIVTPTATYGCECGDGTKPVASCTTEPSCSSSTNSVYYVNLKATASYKPIVPWPGIPSSLYLSSTVQLRASR